MPTFSPQVHSNVREGFYFGLKMRTNVLWNCFLFSGQTWLGITHLNAWTVPDLVQLQLRKQGAPSADNGRKSTLSRSHDLRVGPVFVFRSILFYWLWVHWDFHVHVLRLTAENYDRLTIIERKQTYKRLGYMGDESIVEWSHSCPLKLHNLWSLTRIICSTSQPRQVTPA